MGWRHQWTEKEPRPKLKRLSQEQKDTLLKILEQGIASSPVLTALAIGVRARRGRFYLEKPLYDPEEEAGMEIIGRVTPIAGKRDVFLLEAKKMNRNWYEVIPGTIQEVLHSLANDTRGTFHGLGALEKSLRQGGGIASHLNIKRQDPYRFSYTDTGEECTVQEVLYHVFGVPISVIAEPREWYVYHRTPKIIEVSEDHTSIVVEFTNMDMYYGREIGDTCTYKKQDGTWDIFE